MTVDKFVKGEVVEVVRIVRKDADYHSTWEEGVVAKTSISPAGYEDVEFVDEDGVLRKIPAYFVRKLGKKEMAKQDAEWESSCHNESGE